MEPENKLVVSAVKARGQVVVGVLQEERRA
jgi:hypothetical protein